MIIRNEFEERLFSEYEERLYSTGDNELDELMERAFCDGYEFFQREYSKKNKEKENTSKSKEKVAKGLNVLGNVGELAGLGTYFTNFNDDMNLKHLDKKDKFLKKKKSQIQEKLMDLAEKGQTFVGPEGKITVKKGRIDNIKSKVYDKLLDKVEKERGKLSNRSEALYKLKERKNKIGLGLFLGGMGAKMVGNVVGSNKDKEE